MAGRRFQILFQGGPRIHLRHPAAGNAPPGDDSLGMTAVRAGLAGRPRRSITGYLTKNEGQHDPDAVADESDVRHDAAETAQYTQQIARVHSRSRMMAAATTENRMMGPIIQPPARTISHIGS